MSSPSSKALVRKLDFRFLPFLGLLYLVSNLDRSNIGYAKLMNLELDLHLTSSDFSAAVAFFYVGYILFGLPSTLMLYKTSARFWISLIMILWGVTVLGMAWCQNGTQLMIGRFLLGVFEAGFYPGMVYLFSQWYTSQEQGVRLAIVTCAASLASSIAGLIAFLVDRIDLATSPLSHWQWLFLTEGIPTILLGFIAYFVLPGSLENASWLTEQDRLALKLRNEVAMLSNQNEEGRKVNWHDVLVTLRDPITIMHMLIGLGYSIPNLSMILMLPSIINGLGYSSGLSMVLSIFPHLLATILAIPIAFYSDKTLVRGRYIALGLSLAGLGFVLLLIPDLSHALAYCVLMLIPLGISPCLPINYAWSNNNATSQTQSATRSALIVLFSNVSGLLMSLLYWAEDGPRYIVSHTINLIIVVTSIIIVMLLQWVLFRRNKLSERKFVL